MSTNIKYAANWTMNDLARTCTVNENNTFSELTALKTTGLPWNVATFTDVGVVAGLNDLVIVTKGAKPTAPATFKFTAKIFISNTLTDVDVYRLT